LLGLVGSLRPVLHERERQSGEPWGHFARWISEIVADYWAVARLGVAATLGMIGVLCLPRAFVFKVSSADPHPPPWLRVKLGCAVGHALYPDPQWQDLSALWDALYPPSRASDGSSSEGLSRGFAEDLPELVELLLEHRPASLDGRSLAEATQRRAASASALRQKLGASPSIQFALSRLPPSIACAAVGQARADGQLGPEKEAELVDGLLTQWALERSFDFHAGARPRAELSGLAP
jgi:hypothetical protein